MNSEINSIWLDWREKVSSGVPNPSNDYHLVLLKELCFKRGIDQKIVDNVILVLEKDESKLSKADQAIIDKEDLIWKRNGYGPKDKKGITYKKQDGKLVPVDGDKEDDKEEPEEEQPKASGMSTDDYAASALTSEPDADDVGAEDGDIESDGEETEAASVRNKEAWEKLTGIPDSEPRKKEAAKAEFLAQSLDNMLKASTTGTGAGRYNMSKEDMIAYRDYVKKLAADPENEPKQTLDKIKKEQEDKYGLIEEDDINKFIDDIQTRDKSLKSKIKGKGTPGSNYTTGDVGEERYRNVIKAYLETGGISPITGQVVSFSECQLDHIISLGNGGADGPDNWMFMEERFNQFKGKKTDENVRADVEESYWRTEAEIEAGIENSETKKQLKNEDRQYWKNLFDKSDDKDIGLTFNQIEKMSKPELGNIIYGWNLSHPDNELSRYETQKVDWNGKRLEYARGEGEENPVKPVKGDESTYGLVVDKNKQAKQTNPDMSYDESLKAYNENRPSGGREKNKDQYLEMIKEERLASDSTEIDEVFENALLDHRTKHSTIAKAIKKKVKDAESAPGSKKQKLKIVKNNMKPWLADNPEPNKDLDPKVRKKTPEWAEWFKEKEIEIYNQWSKFDPYSKLDKSKK